ncbi:helix-turn-helix domain-containing protein [Burkholderia multivorans]|uniref:helix-turn-helix domain-containing protein n=1 Tax=Burkholderia multivorans TaxID=87883 RepID=UPI001C24DCDD|nr:helix-turn-helix transcriptional regulator [Burkholderia multivorans]MBU9231409.1 helix-turn-helix domain-containing protein [Burkholderia multivorans]
MGLSQPPGWHREDIKAAIRKRGKTMNDLARERGLPASTVRNALSRPVFSGEIAISEFLGIAAYELWPERWTKDGRRIRPRYANKHISDSSAENANTAP